MYKISVNGNEQISVELAEDGFIIDPTSPTGFRPNFRAYADFGPKMEGQMVKWWDGSIRPYSPQPNNYKDIFRTGFSSLATLSLSNQTENSNYRISASRQDYSGIQRESNQQKNTFSLNSGLKISKKISVDLVANYVNTLVHNRPYQTNRLAQSYDGFFGRQEDMGLILQKYQTSQGYAWVPYNQTARNPSEAFTYNVRANLYDYFFTTLKNTYDENENRLYSSATLNWDVINHLRFRGRIGNDFTGRTTEEKQYNQYPVAFNPVGSSTGAYNVGTGIYSIIYGDALLTYANNITKDFTYSLSAGFTSRTEKYKDETSSTFNGLVSENFFSLSNSYGLLNTSYNRRSLLKYRYFGLLDLSYKN
ncbi:MAG: SusC/RagA family TonB-linked outer membrane protein, partial [Sphingobacteriaceae bacterium]